MRYKIDNDLHIHTKLSLCSSDDEQNTQNILKFAKENGIKTVCITDHFWDSAVENNSLSDWYAKQNFNYIKQVLPLPKDKDVKMLFGCEAEIHRGDLNIGIAPDKYELFDFIVVTATHFHIKDVAVYPNDVKDTPSRVSTWINRVKRVLDSDLPLYKVGLGHLTVQLLAPTFEERIDLLENLPESTLKEIFTKAAQKGVSIELNARDLESFPKAPDIILRPYRIARTCGCKFYLGSDAHHLSFLYSALPTFENVVDALSLTERDKPDFLH